jgi:hypothetical protein
MRIYRNSFNDRKAIDNKTLFSKSLTSKDVTLPLRFSRTIQQTATVAIQPLTVKIGF